MTSPPRIIHLAETISTNADALRFALAGEELPLWVMANRQSAGRGRAGRSWLSPEGNLYASVAFNCLAPLEKAGQLSLVAGIAVFDAIRMSTELALDAGLRLKWPNDLFIGGAKAGGILVESTNAPAIPGFFAVVGFGLNINAVPEGLGREAAALSQHGKAPSPFELLKGLEGAFSRWLRAWRSGEGFPDIREAWIKRAGPVGEAITVNTGEGPITGTYQGLSATGALRAEVDGQLREFNHGDVALVRHTRNDGAQ